MKELICALFLIYYYTRINVNSQITIQTPQTVRSKFDGGFIQGSTAAFGTPSYGNIIMGQLMYGESNDTAKPHCTKDYKLREPRQIDNTPLSKILIVRRGGCHFVNKVKVAQDEFDATAVIIVDDDPNRSIDDIRLIIMADDGWAKKSITIPSLLITYRDGMKLINAVSEGNDILVNLEWDLPNDYKVTVDMWLSPSLKESTRFLKSFAPIAKTFKHKMDFIPHYWIFSVSQDFKDMCIDDEGLFCAFDPDWSGPITGKDVVSESLRQKCLWKMTQTVDPHDPKLGRYSQQYWDYVHKFSTSCPSSTDKSTSMGPTCSYKLMSDIGVDTDKIKLCYKNDFKTILTEEKYTLAWSPSAIMINSWRYSGPMDATTVTRAICTGFTNEQKECESLLNHFDYALDNNLRDIVRDYEVIKKSHSAPFPWWGYVIIVSSVIVIAVGCFGLYRLTMLHKIRSGLRYEVFEEVKNQLGRQNNNNNNNNENNDNRDTLHRDPTVASETFNHEMIDEVDNNNNNNSNNNNNNSNGVSLKGNTGYVDVTII